VGLYSLFIAYDGESKVVRSWDGLAAILTVKMIIRNENFTLVLSWKPKQQIIDVNPLSKKY
jgi:hypothetical protein